MDQGAHELGASLRSAAAQTPDAPAFTFLEEGGTKQLTLTYREIDSQARSIGASLQAKGMRGKRILLLYAPGLDFVAALYGCFYAGAIAVPAYPPDPVRFDRTLPRLQAVVSSAAPALVLTTRQIMGMAQFLLAQAPELVLEWAASDEMATGHEGEWQDPQLSGDDLALLQYTSGSTSTPKGVMVTHANILVNAWMVRKAAYQDKTRIFVNWLPSYHDMGLMGAIIFPVCAGARSVLMSPLEFLKRPLTWLSALHDYRCTDTFAPNFALDLCVRKTTPEERRSLDLSSIELCVVAAEPVRHSTVERFLRHFGKQGFRRSALIPGYGLAEAVVAVSGGPLGKMFQSALIDNAELAENRWRELETTNDRARFIVGCGEPFEEVRIEIVNPDTCVRCGPDAIGEIWVAGPSVTLGYWQNEAETEERFGAKIVGDTDDTPFLRTGDLGYMKGRQLFITGRLKDLIIIRGKNHYPQDIELSVEQCSPRIRQGAVIAFSIEKGGEEKLVIVAEIDLRGLKSDSEKQDAFNEVIREIRSAVQSQHSVQVYAVTLIKEKTIEKTSSGKLARSACKRRFLAATLDVMTSWAFEDIVEEAAPVSVLPSSFDGPRSIRQSLYHVLRRAPTEERRRILRSYLTREITRVMGQGSEQIIDDDTPLQEVGLDSLSVLELTGRIEKELSISLPTVKLLDAVSLDALATYLLEAMAFEDIASSRGAELVEQSLQGFAGVGRSGAAITGSSNDLAPESEPSSSRGPLSIRFTSPRIPQSSPVPISTEAAPPSSTRFNPVSRPSQPPAPRVTQAVALRPFVSRSPLFFIGGAPGSVLYLRTLARVLGAEQPFIAFQAPGFDGATTPLHRVEDQARKYLDEMCSIQPFGPYVLGGHSFGGLVAYEMAQRLVDRGEKVANLILVDSSAAEGDDAADADPELMAVYELINIFRRLDPRHGPPIQHADILSMPSDEQRKFLFQTLSAQEPSPLLQNIIEVYRANFEAMGHYRPLAIEAPVTVVRAQEPFPADAIHPHRGLRLNFDNPALGWKRLCSSLRVISVPGDHFTMVTEPHVQELGSALRDVLAESSSMEIGLERLIMAKSARQASKAIELSRRGGIIFNPFHSDYIEDPYPVLEELRRKDPVHRSPMSVWYVSRHADVIAGLRDKRLSVDNRKLESEQERNVDMAPVSSRPSALSAWFRKQEDSPSAQLSNNFMLLLDPPRHTRIRRLLASSFEPGIMNRWRSDIEEAVDELLHEMKLRRDPDIVRDFATPLPIEIIVRLLGLPRDDVPVLRKWSYDLTQSIDAIIAQEVSERANLTAKYFIDYIHAHIEARSRKPGAGRDLLTLMMEAQEEGDRLSSEELVANTVLLFSAGFETTANVIGNSILALLKNPDQLDLLRSKPELIENAVEELLRYDSAVRHSLRTPLQDIEIGGKLIRRGEPIQFLLLAANRDPEAFPEPNRLDLTRNAKGHVAFAHGIHFCMGAHLARLELQVAIGHAIRSLPNLKLVPGGAAWRKSISFRGLEKLRVTIG